MLKRAAVPVKASVSGRSLDSCKAIQRADLGSVSGLIVQGPANARWALFHLSSGIFHAKILIIPFGDNFIIH